MGIVLAVLLGLFWVVAPFIALYRIGRIRRELRELRARMDAVELADRQSARPAVAPRLFVPAQPAETVQPAQTPWPALPTMPAPEPGASASMPAPVPMATPSPDEIAPEAPVEAERLENLIGSVWLQNAGAVVLLLGVFFFILWGYTTGRFGAGLLVAAGIGLGLISAWRGDHLARSLPRLGHTFIGIGLGIIYLSLYLGHFTLHVLSLPIAFGSLLIASLLAIGGGLRYRVQAIAAIGVVGAFLPQLLAAWIPLKGFSLEPGALLGYFALVDVLVFALAARAGWSALDLAALVLTALTWQLTYPAGAWGWGITISLAALFTGLGFAPLPRLAGHDGRVRSLDLAVIAAAPVGLVISLWEWLLNTPRVSVAELLLTLAALQLLAAWWVDSRRSERDLWRPLTGAAIVFFTAGLQRLVGDENFAMVWCVEGVVLVVLGMSPRGGWLRLWGHAVTGMAVMVVLTGSSVGRVLVGEQPLVHLDALRELAVIVTLLIGAALLARGRAHLGPIERRSPELWTAGANIMLLGWSWRECDVLTHAVEGAGGSWWRAESPRWPSNDLRLSELFPALLGVAWFAQATVLAWLGSRAGRGFLRFGAYVVSACALGAAVASQYLPDGWSSDRFPVLHPAGLCGLASVALAAVIVWRIARLRGQFPPMERYAPEVCTTGLLVLLLPWTARESDHLARMLLGVVGANTLESANVQRDTVARIRTLAPALTSAAWMLEALVLLAIGWVRSKPFLRWAGLVLIGATLLKFTFYDLASADVFWRFVTAIAAGAAMIAVSYAYQRRAKRRRAASVS